MNSNLQRYEIGFPWKTLCLFENNYYCALNQLRCLGKRLSNNPTLKEKYDQTLSTDLINNNIKPVEKLNLKNMVNASSSCSKSKQTGKSPTGGKCRFKVSRTVIEQQPPSRTRSLEQLTWHTATFS